MAVRTAGPGVILSYVIGAIITLLRKSCLAEMAVAHPTAGSLAVYAEVYVSRWAGFTIRLLLTLIYFTRVRQRERAAQERLAALRAATAKGSE